MCKKTPDLLWLKAIIYRIVRICIVFISGYFILGDTSVAMEIAGVDMVAATLFYYYFDKSWGFIETRLKQLYLKWKYRKLG